ncbi:hypothetical protein G3M48_004021 [Beauveria asiatica]|uniref:Uncharacterized protein n=1 Tax=Beauveria asiatica TaxID=1069075 RepID=A0AAW0RU44_9HYPO
MSFSITPRVFSVLCLAVVLVAGQWSGNYNMTGLRDPFDDPPHECWIQSLNETNGETTAVFPCTCIGGEVTPKCSWWQAGVNYNRVNDATCKCGPYRSIDDKPENLKAYGQSQRNPVTPCICEPGPNEMTGPDGLIVPGSECWCPSSSLRDNSGLTEAKEGQAVPESPASVDAASVQKCRDDLNKSSFVKENVCEQLTENKPTEFSNFMKARLLNCTISLLTEVC